MKPPREASLVRGLVWLLVVPIVTYGAYLSVPWFARHVPEWAERKLAERLPVVPDAQICRPKDPRAGELLHRLVERIYPLSPADRKFSVEVVAIRGYEINAFAFLAGKIYVFDGLIQRAESAEELAGVLAHEIEHVRSRHVTEALIERAVLASVAQPALLSTLLKTAANLRFSRDQEREADAGALFRLRDAQVDVAGFRHFFAGRASSVLGDIFSDHPADADRAAAIAPFLNLPSRPIMTPSEWTLLKAQCR